jgi:hypothetical protein
VKALLTLALVFAGYGARAADPVTKEKLAGIFDAVGGESKLLKLFRIKEKLVVNEDPKAKGSERVSVCEPPKYWWVGKTERVAEQKEPATYLVWAWTLNILADPKAKLEAVADIKIGDREAFGIQVGAVVEPAMTLYFDRETKRLERIDWRADRHVFSDWKETDGVKYPSKCVGYKAKTGKPWYHTEILSVERLKELPKPYERK